MGEDEGELAHVVTGEFSGVEVLHNEDTVNRVQTLGNFERPLRVFGRHRSVAPGIAAGECDAMLYQPVGNVMAGPRLAGQIDVGVLPVRPPAGVKQHGIAGFGVEAGHVRRRRSCRPRPGRDLTRRRANRA